MLFCVKTCRGVEQVRIILATNVVSYTVNIFLDYCLLFGKFGFPKLGILGIAIGTVVARLVELVICSIFVLKFESHISFRFRHLKLWDKQLNRDFIKVASPIAAHEVIWSVGTSAASAITGQLGTSVVAGFNVADVLYQLTAAVGNGFLNACSVVIGKTIGSGNIEKVKRQAKTMVGTNPNFSKAVGLSVVSVSFGAQLLGGAVAGVAGATEMMGNYTRFQWTATTGHGCTACHRRNARRHPGCHRGTGRRGQRRAAGGTNFSRGRRGTHRKAARPPQVRGAAPY